MATTNRSNKSSTELSKEVVRSREQLVRDIDRLRDELDFPKKIRRSFQRQPALWITGVAAAGVIVTVMLSRKKKAGPKDHRMPVQKNSILQAGFMLGALRIVANLIKPHLEAFLAQKLRSYGDEPREK
jgi:hypothetical protein